MCGRFVLISSWETIAAEFNVEPGNPSMLNQGDIYPGSDAACIIQGDTGNRFVAMQWGLSPEWLIQKPACKLLINARAESLTEKPTFRGAFQKQRCLIMADGFYEWTKQKKQFCFRLRNKKPFGLAAIFEREINSLVTRASFAIITTEANELVAPVHNRMPVIISADQKDFWLSRSANDPAALNSLLVPYPACEMERHPV